jgi:hypothetical protein
LEIFSEGEFGDNWKKLLKFIGKIYCAKALPVVTCTMHTFEEAWEKGKFKYIIYGLYGQVTGNGDDGEVEFFFRAMKALRKSLESNSPVHSFFIPPVQLLIPWALKKHKTVFRLALGQLCLDPSRDFYLHLAMRAADAMQHHIAVCAIADAIGTENLSSRECKSLCLAIGKLHRHPLAKEIAQKMLRESKDDGISRQLLWKSAMEDGNKVENFH